MNEEFNVGDLVICDQSLECCDILAANIYKVVAVEPTFRLMLIKELSSGPGSSSIVRQSDYKLYEESDKTKNIKRKKYKIL